MILRCYCVDDLPINFECLVRYIDLTKGLELIGTEADSARAIDDLQSGRVVPDIIFLDIDMPGISGLDIAAVAKNCCKIIFTTAYEDYGARSYEFDAIDYLLKPITYPRFINAINKARLSIEKSDQHKIQEVIPEIIFIPGDGKGNFIKVITRDIRYIKAASNFMEVYTVSEKYCSYSTMKAMATSLPPSMFARVHNSYIINVNYIKTIGMEYVKMSDGLIINISRTYRDEIRKFFIRK